MEEINKKIFKPYDIRGIYPKDINEDVAYQIGKGFARMTKARTVVVGRDMRIGSPEMHRGVLRGLLEMGVAVDDIGLVPIDAVYFAVGKFGYDGGLMITASHNPREYNGVKMIGKGVSWIRGTDICKFISGIESIKEDVVVERKGELQKRDIMEKYVEHILSFVDAKKLKPLKVVVDAGNGMSGIAVPKICKNLPIKVVPLFFELDGTFPNRPSNPLEPDAQKLAIKKVLEIGADIGVIIDGDADRIFFIDETGVLIPSEFTLLVLAKHFLEKYPGAGIAYDLISSKVVPEEIKKEGGVPIKSAVGYVNITKKLREKKGIMGGEFTAHYSFKDNFYSDSGLIAMMIMLEEVSKNGDTLSDIIRKFPHNYFRSKEINLTIEDNERAIQKVREYYKDGKQDELDGITIEYPNWWCNVRPSNTEPLLRVTVEATTKDVMEEKVEEIKKIIRNSK